MAPLKTIVPDFAASKTHLVHWGADFEQFNPRKRQDPRCKELRRNYNLEGKFIIIFVSSFKPWHGALDLPAIVAETVRHTQRKVLFVLVGQGEVREEVERMIVTQGLRGNCLFVGQLDHDEVSFWLALADIALAPFNASNYHPIRQFGFFWSPAKIFEYMASGLPVVSANYLPLNRIIQDGFNGRVVKPGDISSYGEVIAQIVENPEHIRRMGANSRRLAEGQFGWCHHARDLERILLKMVSEGIKQKKTSPCSA